MTSSPSSEIFTCTMRLTFRGGSVVTVPTVSFYKKEDAESFNRERMGFINAISRGMAVLPNGGNGVEMPLLQVMGELGLSQVGIGIETGEMRQSSLVVPQQRIILPGH